MELKSTTESLVDIVVRKTTITVNPVKKVSTSRIVVVNTSHAQQTYTPGQEEQLVVRGPGEYEMEGITITALQTATTKGDTPQVDDSFCFAVQTSDQSILVLPSTDLIADRVVEQFGFVDALCVPVDGNHSDLGKSLATLLKGFPDIKQLVLLNAVALNPKALEDVSTTIDPPVSVLRLKDLTQSPEHVEVHLLTPA